MERTRDPRRLRTLLRFVSAIMDDFSVRGSADKLGSLSFPLIRCPILPDRARTAVTKLPIERGVVCSRLFPHRMIIRYVVSGEIFIERYNAMEFLLVRKMRPLFPYRHLVGTPSAFFSHVCIMSRHFIHFSSIFNQYLAPFRRYNSELCPRTRSLLSRRSATIS